MDDNRRFKHADGRLTVYAFACGYIEETPTALGTLRLYNEHGVYHVKHVSHDNRRLAWEAVSTLTEARRIVRKLKKAAQSAAKVFPDSSLTSQ